MKKYSTLILFLLALNSSFSQEAKPKATLATKLVQNSVAGFAPFFFVNFETKRKFNISFYSIFWTNPSFGNLASGSDLLVETGAGLWFDLLDNDLSINPGVGFGHGKFSSDGTGVRIAESIIPNTYVRFNRGGFDFEGYAAYYGALRKDGNITTKDFLLGWAAPGIEIKERIVLGAFFEHFGITRIDDSPDTPTIYTWLGGSIKLKLDNGIAFRFSAGPTLKTDVGTSNEFYKTSMFIPL